MHTDTASTVVITGASSGEMADKRVKSGVVSAFPWALVRPFLGHLPERLANAPGN
ncbi:MULTISPECIES: hypothetical protein [unclassified Pseudomonas]|jgi:hypothetical protein|uniref:hypothetical protein n=1 Tax=unclassified Pseudomonas TaxID=196821 RepID=UPI001CC02043|nr:MULTISPECIES: hypothetical protein [unclassified Pseudomonas]